MNAVSRLSLAFLGSFAVLGGCAQGSTIGTGGAGGDGGSGSGVGSSKASTSGVGHTSAAVTTVAVTSASSGEGGAGGSGPTCDFTEDNSCAVAQGMAAISGDDGGNGSVSGTGSHWVQVHITETNSSIFSQDLAYTVTLTSPPGMIYNLTVHEGSDNSATNCGAAPKVGTPSNAAVQTVHDGWSDTQGLGGEDNSRWLSIEITYVSGTDCTGAWTLGVVGGT